MAGHVELNELSERLERVEAQLAIQQLAVRYAAAADARDLDALIGLFRPDGSFGTWGRDRQELRAFFDRVLRRFYRSMHQVVGHVIEIDGDTATGSVYCRAEHEDRGTWIVMAICYLDRYVRLDGRWFFAAEREVQHWYTCDIRDRPQPPFQQWPGHEHHQPVLPHAFPTWSAFWVASPELAAELSASP